MDSGSVNMGLVFMQLKNKKLDSGSVNMGLLFMLLKNEKLWILIL